MKFKSVEEITSAILPIAESMSIEIVEVEAKVTKSPYLTVYIDTENGVDLDTCEKFHNAIDPILDDVEYINQNVSLTIYLPYWPSINTT
jgi:ribosome maturation factor RimP